MYKRQALQNAKLLKVSLNQVTVQAKLGAMVAYQGDVKFEHAGSGGMGRMLKKAMTGEGQSLMKVCPLYTSDAADDLLCVALGGRRIIHQKTPHYLIYLQ